MAQDYSINIRRLYALFLDIIVVVGLGGMAGLFFYYQLMELGPNAYLVGFGIAYLYHAGANSLLGKGQTVGKMLAGLKVVSKTGERIGLLRSLIRSWLIVPLFFERLETTPPAWDNVLIYVGAPYLFGLVYCALLVPSARNLHDLICGTYVIDAGAREIPSYRFSIKRFAVVIIISEVIAFGGRFLVPDISPDRPVIKALVKTRLELEALPSVQDVGAQIEGGLISVAIQTDQEPFKGQEMARQAARMLIENFGLEGADQKIEVSVMKGYDIEIFHWWEEYDNTLTAKEWGETYAIRDHSGPAQ